MIQSDMPNFYSIIGLHSQLNPTKSTNIQYDKNVIVLMLHTNMDDTMYGQWYIYSTCLKN